MAKASSRFVMNGDVRLHYLEAPGDDDLAPVLFVPGMSDVALDYIEMLPSLGRRSIVIDLRGQGQSAAPDSGYSLADRVTDIETVVSDAVRGPLHLMTFSRGTCYAIVWASIHGSRVRSISIGDYPAREMALPEHAAEAFLTGRWRGSSVASRVSPHALERTFAEATDRPLWHELNELDVPTLVVRGNGGGPMTDDDWGRYATEVGRCERVVFEDSPHDLFRNDRHRYAHLVRRHIGAADEMVSRSSGKLPTS